MAMLWFFMVLDHFGQLLSGIGLLWIFLGGCGSFWVVPFLVSTTWIPKNSSTFICTLFSDISTICNMFV